MIVDDEFLIVKSLSMWLTRAGHHVVGTAGSLARGLELIDTVEMDVAIVDANLNGVSAEPLVQRLSQRKIPTLLITGYSDKQRPPWAPDGFLTKPFDLDALLEAVNSLGPVGQRNEEP